MKKIFKIILICIAVLSIASCSTTANISINNDSSGQVEVSLSTTFADELTQEDIDVLSSQLKEAISSLNPIKNDLTYTANVDSDGTNKLDYILVVDFTSEQGSKFIKNSGTYLELNFNELMENIINSPNFDKNRPDLSAFGITDLPSILSLLESTDSTITITLTFPGPVKSTIGTVSQNKVSIDFKQLLNNYLSGNSIVVTYVLPETPTEEITGIDTTDPTEVVNVPRQINFVLVFVLAILTLTCVGILAFFVLFNKKSKKTLKK